MKERGRSRKFKLENAKKTAPKNVGIVEEIEAFLDNLDVRLAAGEISESTYERLSSKWQKKLDKME